MDSMATELTDKPVNRSDDYIMLSQGNMQFHYCVWVQRRQTQFQGIATVSSPLTDETEELYYTTAGRTADLLKY